MKYKIYKISTKGKCHYMATGTEADAREWIRLEGDCIVVIPKLPKRPKKH